MEKLIHPGILIALLIVLAASAFGGLAVAHGGDQAENECGMNHADDDCRMNHGEEDCPMEDSGMMGMGDDCPLDQKGGMMGMHGGASDSHQGC